MNQRNLFSWTEGIVDVDGEHIKINFASDPTPVCFVANINGRITVQFIMEPNIPEGAMNEIISTVKDELDYYFRNKHADNPWNYAIYHCSTASNIYSSVHWGYYPKGHNEKEK